MVWYVSAKCILECWHCGAFREIYSDGEEPYPGLTTLQARAKLTVQDHRMEMPPVQPLIGYFAHWSYCRVLHVK